MEPTPAIIGSHPEGLIKLNPVVEFKNLLRALVCQHEKGDVPREFEAADEFNFI
jgi:hypothetical protein